MTGNVSSLEVLAKVAYGLLGYQNRFTGFYGGGGRCLENLNNAKNRERTPSSYRDNRH